MKAYILYTKDSPMERDCQNLVTQLDTLRVEHEMVEGDSPQGVSLTELYDLPARPSMVLASGDGTEVGRWENQLPLATDVSYLAHS